MAATQARAKVGGEIGTNGEFYEGGKFLPSTKQPKRSPVKKVSGSKVEIEPYVWVPAQEGKRSIYRTLMGVWAKMVDGKLVASYREETRAYYNPNVENINKMIEMYNHGERWTDMYW